jgi:hypothetical protein
MTERMLKHFRFSHLLPFLQDASRPFHELAEKICEMAPASAERTVSLRKLLEAKDAGVRAVLEAKEEAEAATRAAIQD